MLTSLARHSFGAILLVVLIEEVGIPLPIPSDFLVIFAGTTADRSLPRLVLFFMALTMASAIGASGLYAVVRRGGRPLVERFGRDVHLGPEQLARAEALLSRSGWGGIAVGRATPPHADGGWKVQAEGARRASSVHRTKAEAQAVGRELARSHAPSQLLVYKKDGLEVQEEQTYR
jgi:hypothetical protein